MNCPECHEQAKKIKPNLWYCEGCHVFLFQQGNTKEVLVSKKAFLDPKTVPSRSCLFSSLINKNVQVECVEGIIVEGTFLNVEHSKKGAFGNVLIETCNPTDKTEVLVQGSKIRAIKIIG